MPPSLRRSSSRQSRPRSASNLSFRSSRSSYRNAASGTGRDSPRRNNSAHRCSTSPPRPVPHHHRSPSSSPSRAPNRKRFGLSSPNAVPKVPGKFDFEDKYPEDPIYEEMGPNARLWRAFLDECEVFDVDMVTESRDGLDLLLVFAGLFSAILSTFIVQTSQVLPTNFPALSTSLLTEIASLQRAQINNTPIDDIQPVDTTAGPSGVDIWVNALWFTSLTLSLGTALMAVLVKQWLYQYMSMISGTARDRSLIRFYRFEGLQKWHVLTIIGTLPIVLHIALGLFLAGLVLFLIPLCIPVACIVGFITLIVYTLYAVSNILPIIYIQCPYRTPFSDILNVMLRAVRTFPSLVIMRIYRLFSIRDVANTVTTTHHVFRTLKDAERVAATNDEVAEEVAWRALLWLYEMTSNPPTKRIIQESLGCLPDDLSKRSRELQADLEQRLGEVVPAAADDERRGWFRLIPSGQERRVERILRAVRDPLAPRDGLIAPDALWKLDVADTEFSFKILASILVHAPSISVEIMNSVHCTLPSLLRHLIIQRYSIPIHLSPQLWTHLIASISSNIKAYDSDFFVWLCNLAVQNFEGAIRPTITPPFAGPVTITHKTVPLFHLVVDLLVHRLGVPCATDSFNFEPLTKLFTIYDYAASENSLDFNASTGHPAIFINTWASTNRLDVLCDEDKPILCRRVEDAILRMTMNDNWWNGQDDGRHCLFYQNVLGTYLRYGLWDWHNDGSAFFEKLLSDLSSSLTKENFALFDRFSASLTKLLDQCGNVPAYYPVFCSSPFISSQTLSSYTNCIDFLYPAVSAFVEVTGKVPRDIVLQSLFSEPRRFYTICWILTLGGTVGRYVDWEEHRRVTLLKLAHIDPTHAVWESRTHYMNMDPRDWPYLRLLDKDLANEALIANIRVKMQDSLQILDEFFASRNTFTPDNPTAIPDPAPTKITIPPIISSHKFNASSNPHWRHIRQLVSGTRAFLGLSSASPSNAASDMELGLDPSGVKSGDSGPQSESNVHVLQSTTSHSSPSRGTNPVAYLRPSSDSLHSTTSNALVPGSRQ